MQGLVFGFVRIPFSQFRILTYHITEQVTTMRHGAQVIKTGFFIRTMFHKTRTVGIDDGKSITSIFHFPIKEITKIQISVQNAFQMHPTNQLCQRLCQLLIIMLYRNQSRKSWRILAIQRYKVAYSEQSPPVIFNISDRRRRIKPTFLEDSCKTISFLSLCPAKESISNLLNKINRFETLYNQAYTAFFKAANYIPSVVQRLSPFHIKSQRKFRQPFGQKVEVLIYMNFHSQYILIDKSREYFSYLQYLYTFAPVNPQTT